MVAQSRQERIKEVELQTRLLGNLQKWIRNLLILSSLMLAVAYWALHQMTGTAFTVIGVICMIVMILSVLGCVIVGLGIKRGKANVDKVSITI